jgi:hypothetical protein
MAAKRKGKGRGSGKITDPVLKARQQLVHLTKEEVGEDLDRYRRPFRLERLSRAFYQNIPATDVDYLNQQWYEEFNDVPGRYLIGKFKIDSAMVLDLTSLVFRFLLGNPGNPAMLAEAHPWYLGTSVRLFMHVSGHNPWDQGLTFIGNTKGPIAGFGTLNRNVFTGDDDIPFHLVVQENQEIRFYYDRIGPSVNPPDGSRIGAEINGRWIPQSVWNDMKEDLR